MTDDVRLLDVHVAFDNGTEQDFLALSEMGVSADEAEIIEYENRLATNSVRPNGCILLSLLWGGNVSIPSDKVVWVRVRVRRNSPCT